MAYRVEIAPAAAKALGKLPTGDRGRVAARIDALGTTPRPMGCVKLTGEDLYRIRVGDYRVVYTVEDKVVLVLVLRIAHRREVYR